MSSGADAEQASPAFESFFREFEPVLRRVLVAGFGQDLGREATAEALAYGWANWERVREMENRGGYLYRVGERWARRQRDRRTRPVFRSVQVDAEDPRFEPGLGPALAALSRRQRQAVVLVSGCGLSHSEAAEVLGLSRSSVQNHVERGMRRLRAALGVDK